MQNNKIFVTKTFLPPFEEYAKYLKRAWDKGWITNHGELAVELEDRLKKILNVKHALFVTNGTTALQLAIKALDLKGEIITTPFTFAATTTSILWEKCKPVFVDIDPETFTIDTNKIENAITKNTQAILAVHVYGYPCNVDAIEKIARKHNLKVIYDAAHAFGVKINGKSIFQFGDISILSLHATKFIHTVEGGLICTNNDSLAKKIELLRDFGLEGENIVDAGINAKNSEFHAAMGLTNLNYISKILNSKKQIISEYKKLFLKTSVCSYKYRQNIDYNYAYFPVVFRTEEELLTVKDELEKENIFVRRYFYPSLNKLPFVEYVPCPISESIAERVLCLPIYHNLSLKIVRKIAKIVIKALDNSLPTLAIGIPTYNEEGNIVNLLKSILSQTQKTYIFKEIIINSDASSDNTIALITKFFKNNKKMKLINNNLRKGKPFRLNEIYKLHDSDYLLTLDADIIFDNFNAIEEMFKVFRKDNQAVVVAGRLIPSKPTTFIGKVTHNNDLLWNSIRENINGGDHIANNYGEVTMLKKEFSKSIIYPSDISCDEEYLYVKAKEKNGFRYAKNATALFKSPETLKEAIFRGRRFLKERNALVKYFGNRIHAFHNIPLKYKLNAISRMLLKNPVFTTLSIILNIFIRIFPYNDDLNKKGMWEIATSTKIINKI
jgi:dTDP-4-amino-4,6-dideoxygalactose transaminase/glycosyltransferase involved in cell wall biosynthesis